jgi:serine/threonine protein kinase
VYKGRWNSTDVAVKVIQHDAAQAEEVENEVLLMMGLQHECSVAAYHFIVYVKGAAVALQPAATALTDVGRNSSSRVSPAHDAAQQLANGHDSGKKTAKREPTAKQKAESQLVMEFCDRGTLAHAAGEIQARWQQQHHQQQQQQAGANVPLQVLLLLWDVARGLQALHSRKVVHGDLVSCVFQYEQ